jgi:hypothetical protein
MAQHASIPDRTQDAVVSPHERAERRLALLDDLAEIGVELTRSLKRHVLAAEQVLAAVAAEEPTAQLHPPIDAAAVAIAYNRIARAVRMTLALQARLEACVYRTAQPAAALARSFRSPADGAGGDHEQRDRESAENLFDPDEAASLLDRPARDVILKICRDLGLSPADTAAVQTRWAETQDEMDQPASAPGAPGSRRGRFDAGFQHEDHKGHEGPEGKSGAYDSTTARARAP